MRYLGLTRNETDCAILVNQWFPESTAAQWSPKKSQPGKCYAALGKNPRITEDNISRFSVRSCLFVPQIIPNQNEFAVKIS